MRAIWKFPLPLVEQPAVQMPAGARILSVGAHGEGIDESLVVWADIPDTGAKKEIRYFFVLGTGNSVDWQLEESTFIGTVQMGSYVWHVWDQRSPHDRGTR
jgi:hypothetical protein